MNQRFKLFLSAMFCFIFNCYSQTSEKDDENRLYNSVWYAESNLHSGADSLRFISNKQVKYYLSELGADFISEYKIENNILTILTDLSSFESAESNWFSPNLKLRFKIHKDSLELIYLANFEKKWIEASEMRYQVLNNFKKKRRIRFFANCRISNIQISFLDLNFYCHRLMLAIVE